MLTHIHIYKNKSTKVHIKTFKRITTFLSKHMVKHYYVFYPVVVQGQRRRENEQESYADLALLPEGQY